jgi:hypothetical protein
MSQRNQKTHCHLIELQWRLGIQPSAGLKHFISNKMQASGSP